MAAKASRKPPVPEQSAEAKKIAELEREVAKHLDRINTLMGHLESSERRAENLDRKLARKVIMFEDAQRVIKAQALVIADARHAEIEQRVARIRDMASDIPF